MIFFLATVLVANAQIATHVRVTGIDSGDETITGQYTYLPGAPGLPEGPTSFQWRSAEDAGGPFTDMTGATNSQYTLVAGDDNRWFEFEVTVLNTDGDAGAPVSAMLEFADGDGTAAAPWQIGNAIQLSRMALYTGAAHTNKHFLLIRDIDLDDPHWSDGAGWLPVGDTSVPFSGSLDGDGHAIRHLSINRPGSYYVGLFGRMCPAQAHARVSAARTA